MGMKDKKMKVGVLLVAILVCSFLGMYFYARSGGRSSIVAEGGQTFPLVSPAFAQSTTTGTTFLEEEAGMSIYVNIGASIDLSIAKPVYKTIEKETADYIVGSVSLPDLPETDDVHCFVHKDGWIVVYYLKAEPISKIIDWNYYSGGKLTKTKLQVGLEKMGLALGANVAGAKYYNFQYPYADKWMIIFESIETGVEDTFNVKIPSTFNIYERSWSLHSPTGYLYLYIDDAYIDYASGGTRYGTLTAAQLAPDVFHTVKIHSQYDGQYYTYRSAIALTYKEA
jgi:hypothetical protein